MKKRIWGIILISLVLAVHLHTALAADTGIFQGHLTDGALEEDNGIIQGHIVDGVLAEDGGSAPEEASAVPASFTVTFYPGGDGTAAVGSKQVTNGRAYGELPVPSRSGYVFRGWRDADGSRITANTVVQLAEDQALYADWEAAKYRVTLHANGGAVNGSAREVMTVVTGGVYGVLPVPVCSGCRFEGWFTSPDGGEPVGSRTAVVRTEDHALYAHWSQEDPAPSGSETANAETAADPVGTDPANAENGASASAPGSRPLFRDVPRDSSYYNAVYWAVRNGITSGTSPETFSPNDPCKRKYILTFLWRANG